jgi:hypothetical protein
MITSSRACFRIPALPPNRNTIRHRKSWRRSMSTRMRSKLLVELPSAMPCARFFFLGGAPAQLARAAYRAARLAARVSAYCALAKGAYQIETAKAEKISRSWVEGRWGWQQAGWVSEGWASGDYASVGWASGVGRRRAWHLGSTWRPQHRLGLEAFWRSQPRPGLEATWRSRRLG